MAHVIFGALAAMYFVTSLPVTLQSREGEASVLLAVIYIDDFFGRKG